MSVLLSQKKIGRRLNEIRKMKGLSQEELAKSVKISRPSLAQIESGNRRIDILELQKLSLALGFSLDAFMAGEFFQGASKSGKGKKKDERISIPTLQLNKFKNVLLHILERCAGKPNADETVLHKLLYFSDFNYYELHEEHLTGATYRKLPHGPVPQKFDALLNQLIGAGQLQRVKTQYHGYSQVRYLPLEKADLSKFRAVEKDAIDKVIEQMSDWSAAFVGEYARKDLPWEVTEEGKAISYELAFYRELPYSVRVYEE